MVKNFFKCLAILLLFSGCTEQINNLINEDTNNHKNVKKQNIDTNRYYKKGLELKCFEQQVLFEYVINKNLKNYENKNSEFYKTIKTEMLKDNKKLLGICLETVEDINSKIKTLEKIQKEHKKWGI